MNKLKNQIYKSYNLKIKIKRINYKYKNNKYIPKQKTKVYQQNMFLGKHYISMNLDNLNFKNIINYL